MKNCINWMVRQWILQSRFWTSLFVSAALPATHKFLMTNVSEQLVATKGIMMSIGVIVASSLFNRYGDRVYKTFLILIGLEIIGYATIIPMVMTGYISPSFYYIVIALVDIVLARNISCCKIRIRRLTYEGEVRETHDLCKPIAEFSAAMLGGGIAMIGIPLWLAWIFLSLGVIIGDILLVMAWYHARDCE